MPTPCAMFRIIIILDRTYLIFYTLYKANNIHNCLNDYIGTKSTYITISHNNNIIIIEFELTFTCPMAVALAFLAMVYNYYINQQCMCYYIFAAKY